MQERSIEWLKKQELNRRFTVCKDSDRKLVHDKDFEDWIVTDSWKHVSTCGGDGFTTDDEGFTFSSMPTLLPKDPKNPFPFIQPIYSRYRCSWKNVTAVFEGEGGGAWIYIFTAPQRRKRSKKTKGQ